MNRAVQFARRIAFAASLVLVLTPALGAPEPPIPAKIKFNRDVRPILSDNCFHCHGFDVKERKADRRLNEAVSRFYNGE